MKEKCKNKKALTEKNNHKISVRKKNNNKAQKNTKNTEVFHHSSPINSINNSSKHAEKMKKVMM